ncbi:hypothetical protein FFWV33_12015 [Flavobacterium faecale]|uniref:Carrier domain-containing protein n=1 Tax=Flavobacterium faecale TaxID=1355330 RepID=A0A2S1LF67_9FLAO|nr:non-ribosomal peptide synthetase [Flavobacterium faecale]AWG22186.1 hypothetical protein FFWV33_12015 [Flavobacterium faecale]
MVENSVTYNPFTGPEIDFVLHTTKSQAEIWTACYFGGENAARSFNESTTLVFDGAVDTQAMEAAVQAVVARHESLRATFSPDGLYMTVYKKINIPFEKIDLSNETETNQENIVSNYVRNDAHFLFDLVHGPLIKVALFQHSATKYTLVLTAHHIVCDGWSFGVLFQDLGALYTAHAKKQTPILENAVPFSAYATEELHYLQSEENIATENFWLSQFEEDIPLLDLPTDFIRPQLKTYEGNRLDFELNAALVAQIKQTGRQAGTSLVTTLVTIFELLLYKITGQNDLVIGMPFAGQPVKEMSHLIGHCVNLLPLRSSIEANSEFTTYLKKRKSELLDAYEYPNLTFGQLLQKLPIARDPSRVPLLPVVFNVDLGMNNGVQFADLQFTRQSNPKAFESFELFLNLSEKGENFIFEWSYKTALFEAKTIEAMMLSFENIMKRVAENPNQTIGDIVYEDFSADYTVLNQTETLFPDHNLHELFAAQVTRTPDAVAVIDGNRTVTYIELWQSANQMANYLSSQGLCSGQIVAISLDRSPELLMTIFAVLQCGAAYVPIDPAYPQARQKLMIEDSNAQFFIGQKETELFELTQKAYTIAILLEKSKPFDSKPLSNSVSPNEIAYIIYTSGSTGKPKGVQVMHKNVSNLVCSMAKEPGIDSNDKVLCLTTISFDAMVMETFLPLLHGATIVMVDEQTRRDGRLLLQKMADEAITLMWGTPTIWQILLDSGWDAPLSIKALIGGEAVPLTLAKELLDRCQSLWNIYGPTETTVCCILSQINKDDAFIAIGKPIANTQIHLLNALGQPVKKGQLGEIAISGAGVSSGYLGQQELTDERYVFPNFTDQLGGKQYLSGDIGKLLDNNTIQYIGRADNQVKIRGYRIELGEIEHAITNLNEIKTAVVLTDNDSLIAFLIPQKTTTDEATLLMQVRNHLTIQLPSFMVPSVFYFVDQIPMTTNGKIDDKALLQLKAKINATASFSPPRTDEEVLVAEIWKKHLKLPTIDIFSNFFEMGGHSIIAVKVMSEFEKKTGKTYPISSLFEHSTVEKFAKLIQSKTQLSTSCLVPLQKSGNKPPLFIIHGAGLNILNFVDLSKHFDPDQPVYGIQGTARPYSDWYHSIEDMAAQYIEAIVALYPSGPYALAGFSFGGVVAFEMTRQLEEQGRKVILTALLDTTVDHAYYQNSIRKKEYSRQVSVRKKRMSFLMEMLFSWRAMKDRTLAKKDYLFQKYVDQDTIMTAKEADALAQFTAANEMVNGIVDLYQLKPQSFSVDLFRSKDDVQYKTDPIYLGWKKAVPNGIRIHEVSGNHLEIVAPPNDIALAGLLQTILNERAASI